MAQFALVESGSVTKLLNGNQGIKIGDYNYPTDIYTKWTEAERNNIGIYTIENDDTNFKNQKWYINTAVSYSFGSGKVTASYGSATARAHADTLFTQADEDNGLGTKDDVKQKGLKSVLIQQIKDQAKSILDETDWYITRKAEKSTAIPSSITTHRDAVRTKQASMITAITNASDTPALETLYTYTTTDGVTSRPLGELPTLS
tara:strand:- start:196 stop:804 length:609 start_codon:yes stop_codon:yes gene_type:complete